MIRIGLTGSIGMGKSTVARLFAAQGIPVFDSDAVVRALQDRGGGLIGPIGERFPGSVADGILDRDRLAALVLGNPSELAALEAIVHPAVQAERARFLDRNGDAPALLFDVPLLFETGAEEQFDHIIVVTAPEAEQRRRVMARTGMDARKLDAILARQIPDREKRERADFVIDNGGSIEATESQVESILACLGLDGSG